MTESLHNRLEEAMLNLREQEARMTDLQSKMASQVVELHSKNRMVRATVDSAGRLTNLTFEGKRYRTIAPAELADIVVDTVRQAQETAAEQAMAEVTKLMPEGMDLPGLDGSFDIAAIFSDARKLASMPIFDDDMSPSPSPIGEKAAETRTAGR